MTDVFEWTSSSEAETDRFGRALAELLEPGAIVALVGDLGAGKTRLSRAIVAGLGADPDEVQSPTFVLQRDYEGRLPIHHFDTYRLEDVDQFLELGVEDLFADGDGVCLIEWADRVQDVLPDRTWCLEITAVGETARSIRLSADRDLEPLRTRLT